MKKLLLLAGVAAFAATSVSARGLFPKQTQQQKAQSEIKKKMAEVRKMNEAAHGTWLPGKMVSFSASNNEWYEGETTLITYYEDGAVKTETQQGLIITAYYDDMRRVSKMVVAQEETPDQALMTYSFSYDHIVPNAIVKTVLSMSYMGTTLSETVGAEVTRDASGNVTNVDIYELPPMGSKEYESKMSVVYGSDGKANKITTVYYDDGEVDYTQTYRDIVWENTDGQILTTDMTEDNFESGLFWGANRIRSCQITDDELPGVVLDVDVAYNPSGYKTNVKMNGQTMSSIDYTKVDEFGSYDSVEYSADADMDDPTGAIHILDSETETTTYRVDSYGLVLENTEHYEYEKTGKKAETYYTLGHVDYNSEFGYPEEYWSEEGYNDNTPHKAERILFSEYEFYASGVKGVEASESDSPAEYYNLHGVRVDNPGKGIYIMRQGGKTTKVMR